MKPTARNIRNVAMRTKNGTMATPSMMRTVFTRAQRRPFSGELVLAETNVELRAREAESCCGLRFVPAALG